MIKRAARILIMKFSPKKKGSIMLEIVFFILCTMLTYKLHDVCFKNVHLSQWHISFWPGECRTQQG